MILLPEDISTTLPPDAVAKLRAATTLPYLSIERQKAIEKATDDIRAKYPQFFTVEKES